MNSGWPCEGKRLSSLSNHITPFDTALAFSTALLSVKQRSFSTLALSLLTALASNQSLCVVQPAAGDSVFP